MIPEWVVMGSVGHTFGNMYNCTDQSKWEQQAVLSPDSSFSPHLPVVTWSPANPDMLCSLLWIQGIVCKWWDDHSDSLKECIRGHSEPPSTHQAWKQGTASQVWPVGHSLILIGQGLLPSPHPYTHTHTHRQLWDWLLSNQTVFQFLITCARGINI